MKKKSNRNIRLIARLDIKGENLIKTIQLEGLKVIGSPGEHALKYYVDGADELLYMDCVASLYGRNHLLDIIRKAAENIFIPITVGGGIRSVGDALEILRSGADKVAINTAAVLNPTLIEKISKRFGSQCVVLSVEAKKVFDGKWEVYTNNGREHTGLNVIDWIKKAVNLGAGEVLLTSVDKEGTKKGFDLDLVKSVSEKVNVPIVASGGMGELTHLNDIINKGGADAVALAGVLHYDILSFQTIREYASNNNMNVREYERK